MLTLDTTGAPPEAKESNFAVGNVFKKDGGPAGYMLIVAITGVTGFYIAYDLDGTPTGAGQANSYYFSRRKKVGHVDPSDWPPLPVVWE